MVGKQKSCLARTRCTSPAPSAARQGQARHRPPCNQADCSMGGSLRCTRRVCCSCAYVSCNAAISACGEPMGRLAGLKPTGTRMAGNPANVVPITTSIQRSIGIIQGKERIGEQFGDNAIDDDVIPLKCMADDGRCDLARARGRCWCVVHAPSLI